ncbi:MAG: peptide deformylase [Okeania sp. SIO1I7]|nr:peptide deformylase [Okeania sp. SIO1I7]NET24231.1 peptide deformylase [Okeania sp. SIO1I7]
MMAVLQVAQLGNKILRYQAQPINNIWDKNLQELIDNLIVTIIETNGVGIAAPQVSISDRLFIVASRPNLRYPNAPKMEPTAMINPKLISYSEDRIKGWEGCLSVPGIRGLVPRYRVINVEYTNREGKLERQELTDFVARIFQHEYDHLEGLVFLDRVESSTDLMTEDEYQKQIIQSRN